MKISTILLLTATTLSSTVTAQRCRPIWNYGLRPWCAPCPPGSRFYPAGPCNPQYRCCPGRCCHGLPGPPMPGPPGPPPLPGQAEFDADELDFLIEGEEVQGLEEPRV